MALPWLQDDENGIGVIKKKKDDGGKRYLEGDPSGGKFWEYTEAGGGKLPGAQVPGQAQFGTAFGDQLKAAENYRDTLKSKSDTLYNAFSNRARRDLDKGIKNVKNDFASRGLLGSGMQGAAEGGMRAATASGLAEKRAEINQGLLGNLGSMESGAYDLASAIANTRGPDTYSPYLSYVQTNMANQAEDDALANQMYGQIGQGLGGLGGSLLANSMAKQNPMSNVTQYGPWAGGMGYGSMNKGYYK